MIIEIRQAGFVNKGAELMLHAIVEKLRARYPDAKLTMAPIFGGAQDTFEKMRALNLYPKAWFWHRGIDFGEFAKWVPKGFLKVHGMVTNEEIDVVLDAAGFAYSDQWGVANCRELSLSSRKWARQGTKLILLPQALGPFSSRTMQKNVRTWAGNADLIFARERDSYDYLTAVVGEQEKIALAPDFTNLLSGALPPGFDTSDKQVAIVPNYRMVDKTDAKESAAYLPFLVEATRFFKEQGAHPFLLIHEGADDRALADRVVQAVGEVPIVRETNPIFIKGILGACRATLGSRFHGLVSALAQGVPSLATGWSHKYQRLFEDYEFPEGCISATEDPAQLREKLARLLDPAASSELRATLCARAEVLKARSEVMWQQVFACIDDKSAEARPR